MACSVHAREIEKSTITSVLNECLRDFPHIGALRKEHKTCLVNLAQGKNVFTFASSPLSESLEQATYSSVDIGHVDIRIYIEPPLVHIDGQRNSNMASYSDVLLLNTYYYCDFCCVLAHNALFCIRQYT